MAAHTVLIPLDGSAFSKQIFPHVRRFLPPESHRLLLLRVTQPPAGVTGRQPRPVATEWTAPLPESQLDAEYSRHPIYASQEWSSLEVTLADELDSDVRMLQSLGYTVSVAVRFGDPAHEIVAAAQEEPVDIIAMATHGRTGLSHLVLGSVAERVLHAAGVPVLLVRPFDH